MFINKKNEFFSQNNIQQLIFIAIVLILSILCRLLFINRISIDMDNFFLKWVDFIRQNGYFHSLGRHFSDYNPPYLYLLILATLTPFRSHVAIKLISFIFELFSAVIVFFIIKKYTNIQLKANLGFALVLLSPIIWVDSAIWGQNDIIYTTFLLLSFWFITNRNNWLAFAAFAIAFSFKAQAIFFAPWLLMLIFSRRVRIREVLIMPIIFILMLLPAIFAGRPWTDVLSVYFGQFGSYTRLSMNAPNLYIFFPDSTFKLLLPYSLFFASVIILFMVFFFMKSLRTNNNSSLLSTATFFLFLTPFVLPKMHDRYFFAAAIFALPFSMIKPRMTWLAVILQATSLLAFIPFLTESSITWPVKIGALI